jgi:hypothetical protein
MTRSEDESRRSSFRLRLTARQRLRDENENGRARTLPLVTESVGGAEEGRTPDLRIAKATQATFEVIDAYAWVCIHSIFAAVTSKAPHLAGLSFCTRMHGYAYAQVKFWSNSAKQGFNSVLYIITTCIHIYNPKSGLFGCILGTC